MLILNNWWECRACKTFAASPREKCCGDDDCSAFIGGWVKRVLLVIFSKCVGVLFCDIQVESESQLSL